MVHESIPTGNFTCAAGNLDGAVRKGPELQLLHHRGAGPGVNANAIMQSFFGTTSYFSYLVCGMVVFIVLFNSAFSGMSVVWDRRFGFMNKALSTPISRGTIVMGKILQSVGRSLIQAVAVLLIGIALGMETSNLTVLGIAGTFVVIFLVAMALSGLFVMLSLRSSNWQTQMAIINLLNLPLLFASNALFPVKIMPTWLQDVVKVNPISYSIDAIRQLLIGATGSYPLWVDFSVGTGVRGLLLHRGDCDVVETAEQVASPKFFIAVVVNWAKRAGRDQKKESAGANRLQRSRSSGRYAPTVTLSSIFWRTLP